MTFLTTPLVRSFVGFDTLFDELEKVSNFKETSYPAYNIEKTNENSYEITTALAGFEHDQISVEIEQNVLTISTTNKTNDESRTYLHKGIASRAFTKKFRLADHIEVESATLENGILTIKLIKNIPDAELPRKIEIKAIKNRISSKAA